MKKLAFLFASILLLSTMACKDDEVVQQFPIVGTWMPIAEARTTVQLDGTGVTDNIDYSDCQKQSRWVFKSDLSGKRTNKEEIGVPGVCTTVSDRTFSYNYDAKEKNFEIKYQGTVVSDKGKVITLDAETLNIKIEDTTNPLVYKSTTYTLKRITL